MATEKIKPQVEWLFANPLLGFMLPSPEKLNDQLWRDACALRQQEEGVNRSNLGGWHSKVDIFLRSEASFRFLRQWVLRCSIEACSIVNKKFLQSPTNANINAWVNINAQGSLNTPHAHPGCHWSGVYYARVPDPDPHSKSGLIEFLDPRGGVIHSNSLPGADCFRPNFSLVPRNGMLLLFPPYLVHWVYPNEKPEERMSIAFNINYTPVEAEDDSKDQSRLSGN